MAAICESFQSFEVRVMAILIGWCRFVATEEGILEYAVNIDGRKTFPGVAFL